MRIVCMGQIIPNGLSVLRTRNIVDGYESGVIVLVFPLFAFIGDYLDPATYETYHNVVHVKKVMIQFRFGKRMVQFANVPKNLNTISHV